MRFKNIFPLLVFLGMILGSAGASASIPVPVTSIQAVTSSNLIQGTVGVWLFENYWTFILGSNSAVESSVTNNFYGINLTNFNFVFQAAANIYAIQDITDLRIDLYAATLGSSVNSPLSYSSTSLWDSNAALTLLNSAFLDAGNYALKVSGNGVGTRGGEYSGSFFINSPSPSAVPTPQTWAMLLVGVLLVGFQMRRKSADQDLILMTA